MAGRVVGVTLVALVAGLGIGYLLAPGPEPAGRSAEQRVFEIGVEEHAPTCAQLGREGLHGPLRHGDDLFFVQVGADYFYVIGLRVAAGQPPLTAWWGAARASARAQACAAGG